MKLPLLTQTEPEPTPAINDGVYTPTGRIRRKRGPNKPKAPPVQNASLYAPTFFQLCIGLSILGAWATKNKAIVMSDSEAASIAEPASRLFAKTELAHKYGKIVAEGNDWIALSMACMGYGARVLSDTETGNHKNESVRHTAIPRNQKPSGFDATTASAAITGNGSSASSSNDGNSEQSSSVGLANGQLINFTSLRNE